jgi:hypothetical protein
VCFFDEYEFEYPDEDDESLAPAAAPRQISTLSAWHMDWLD